MEESENLLKYKEVAKILKSNTTVINYKIKIVEESANIFDSKIGGIPYWDSTKTYPKGKDGNNMILLAQINLDKENIEDKRLPQKGILQFYVENGFISKHEPSYKVIYHSNIIEEIKSDDVLNMGIKSCLDPSVEVNINKEYKIRLENNRESISHLDMRIDEELKKAYNQVFNYKADEFDDKFEDDLELWYENGYIYDDLSDGAGHKLFGYPHFCQGDIREELAYKNIANVQENNLSKSVNNNDGSYVSWFSSANDMKKNEEENKNVGEEREPIYDTLLLQIDSCNEFQWIDGGQVNIFINSKKLENFNFENVLGNVDFY